MKTNFTLLFYMKKQKNYQNGKSPIYLRITVAGKRSEITTGLVCEPERWNTKNSRQIGTREDVRNFNAYLDNLQSMVYQAHKSLSESDELITAESIKYRFLGKEIERHTLMEVVKAHNQKMEALVGSEYAVGTLKRFEVLERHLIAFMQKNIPKQISTSKKLIIPLSMNLSFSLEL